MRRISKIGYVLVSFMVLFMGSVSSAQKFTPEDVEQYKREAQQGNDEAQFFLGDAYYFGDGIEQDYVKAKEWWEKAAKQGHLSAQYNLGYLHANGQGVRQDYAKAAEWYEKAANQGHAKAQFNLGSLYYEGYGVPKSYVHACMWWVIVSATGDEKAKSNLGIVIKQMTQEEIATALKKAVELLEANPSWPGNQ